VMGFTAGSGQSSSTPTPGQTPFPSAEGDSHKASSPPVLRRRGHASTNSDSAPLLKGGRRLPKVTVTRAYLAISEVGPWACSAKPSGNRSPKERLRVGHCPTLVNREEMAILGKPPPSWAHETGAIRAARFEFVNRAQAEHAVATSELGIGLRERHQAARERRPSAPHCRRMSAGARRVPGTARSRHIRFRPTSSCRDIPASVLSAPANIVVRW
jgi:hypothetical protein